MKRELKGVLRGVLENSSIYGHKANPDEKGTESELIVLPAAVVGSGHKANPDEKGTERDVVPYGHIVVSG